jgi:hypothetical protein
MRRSTFIWGWALAAALLIAPAVQANSWNEATDGDLSGDRLAPTSLALSAGDNSLTGTVVAGDIDYLTVIVPAGYTLSQINLLSFSSTDDLAFIGMQAGSTFTEAPTTADVTKLLGWAHFGLPAPAPYFATLGASPGAIGFTAPLPAGPYTFWVQQTGAQQVAYGWGFVVAGSAAPEPATAGLVLLGLGALLGRVANRFLRGTE